MDELLLVDAHDKDITRACCAVTLASTSNALPDDGVTAPQTCQSCFNVNFNVNFKIVFLRLVHQLVYKKTLIADTVYTKR
jgi:hypothetical protein